MTAGTSLESPTSATGRPALRIGVFLAFGLLSLVISLMTVAQSHTMAYVDEMTGEERIVHCGSMPFPTDLPDNVPAEYARSCDPVATRNVLYAVGFAAFGGIAAWSGIRDLRTPRRSSS